MHYLRYIMKPVFFSVSSSPLSVCRSTSRVPKRSEHKRHFKETGSDIGGIVTLLLPIYAVTLLSPSANVRVKGEINSLSSEDTIRARSRLLNSHFVARLTDIEARSRNAGLLHYIIATVMRHKYLVVHKDINSACKYLSVARRERNLRRGEKTTGEIGGRKVEIRFESRSAPQSSFPEDRSVSRKSCCLHDEETMRETWRSSIRASSNHFAFAFPQCELPPIVPASATSP